MKNKYILYMTDNMYGNARNNKGKIEINKKVKPGKCIIPFKYKWQTQDKCYETSKGPICATSVSKRGTLKTYGYCYKKNRTKKKARKLKKKVRLPKTPTRNTIKKTKPRKKNTIKKFRKKIKLPLNKIELQKAVKNITHIKPKMNYTTQFITLLEKLESLMTKKGQHFRGRAYSKAKDSIILYGKPIHKLDDIKDLPNIGSTMLKKFKEYMDTGTLQVLETAKNDPMLIFTEVYGIGAKKAEELVKTHKVTTIEELRSRQDELLNDKQKIGLKHYEDILKRIPRNEILQYEKELKKIFKKVKNKNSTFQIVGSFRRGKPDSGDIDICVSDPDDDVEVFNRFLDALIEKKMLIEVLSRGNVKSLGVSRLRRKPARRIDFMFTPRKELSFALLYFTGSKTFNTVMRKRALDLGYSMNEHGLYKMEKVGKSLKKGKKLEKYFPEEIDVFNFLGMEFKSPQDRINGTSVVLLKDKPEGETKTQTKVSLKTTRSASTKSNVKSFQKYGQSFIEKLTEQQLSEMIRLSNKLYYCNNKPLLSDEEYDILKEYIEEKYPNNKAIKEGHTMCSVAVEKRKMDLPFEMWSMDKIKSEKDINLWLKKYKGKYVISAKVDGVSAGYSTKMGKPTLFTRGNGRKGQDISHAIKYLNLPDKPNLEIRGELLMKKQVFDMNWSDRFKNVRNMIAGTANAKESLPERWADIDFVAYEIVSPELKPSEQFRLLKALNCVTVINKGLKKINKENLSKYLQDWRENYDYDIDGIIVTDDRIHPRITGNPKHSFAFKMVLGDQIAESKVVDVIWSPSKDGYLKPKVQLQPVELGGAEIRFATLHNAEFVMKNKIGIGAVVQLIRSGDVIPKVQKVIKPAREGKMPDESYNYQWNATHKDLVLVDAAQNSTVQMKIIEDFFKKLDVAGLGRGNVKKIMNADFDTIPKILQASIEDLETVQGFKTKTATKIHNSIQEQMDKASITKLASASNMFGRGLGEKRMIQILKTYPNILVSKESADIKIQKISALPGFKTKTAEMFVPYIPQFVEFLTSINRQDKLTQVSKTKKVIQHQLTGKRIVMTGFGKKEKEAFKEKLDKYDIKLGSSVSKKTFAVLVKSLDEDTDKAETARQLNIPLLTPETFLQKYDL